MNKEELIAQGWNFTYSGPSAVTAWGNYMVHLYNSVSGHRVSGYGTTEEDAINNAVATIGARK
jgi:hypothetical protein